MPSKSPAQAKLMRAVAHGWKPTRMKGPPVGVAKEFVAADRKYSGGFAENRYYEGGPVVGMYEGGLAPMNDIIQRGFAPSLHMGLGGMLKKLMEQKERREDPNWEDWMKYSREGDEDPLTYKQVLDRSGRSGISNMFSFMEMQKLGWTPSEPLGEGVNLKSVTWTPPQQTILGGAGAEGEGGMSGPPGVVGPSPVTPSPPRDPRAGRDTEYSAALRAHKARVAQSLAVPPGGYAGGGQVNYYDEGGAVRPGHAEGANPYPEGSARYNYWESRKHVDPPPPEVVEAPPAEDLSWLDRILGRGEDYKGRSERELEELERNEAYGGYIDAPGYQFGGLAAAQAGFRGQPRGGVPPQMRGMPPSRGGRPPWRGAPPSRAMPGRGFPGPRGMPPGMQKPMPWRGAPPPRMVPPSVGQLPRPGGFPPGKGPRMQVPPSPPRGLPGGGGPAGGEGPGIPGGPRVPPNMRGFLQRQRMMNRPPANVGGGANRVGQQDQQGGLARALQRGTGRPPMSRRGGFPGRAR